MKVKKWLRGLLSLALSASVINAFGGSSVMVYAEEGDADGIVANKSAKVNEDGSYTISLDAYVKGEVITTTTPVDVVLVVDVSNSMGWAMENFEIYNNPTEWQKCAKNGQTSKMKNAMDAADAFADILLGDNAGKEEDLQNTLTFVTFAGLDKESADDYYRDYIDSVQTLFDSETSASTAKSYFEKVVMAARNNNNTVTYSLQLPVAGDPNRTVNGTNLGGTNYDYAFYEANEAIDTVQGKYADYSETGRKTFVVFMTDGAPDQYNGYCYQRSSAYYHVYQPNTRTTYQYDGSHQSHDEWLNYLNNTPNTYAWDVYSRVDGQLFTVGFDLAHGGFSGNQWTERELSSFLEGMVGHEKTIDVKATADEEELKEIFKDLASKAKAASMELSSQAVMKDIVSKSFTLPPGASTENIKVQVVQYDTTNNKWSETPQAIDGSDGQSAWERANNENIKVNINEDTVDVTGFDYSKHCLADSTDDPSLNDDAAKLVVSFIIYAKPESITGASEQTNDENSGIYDENNNCVFHFEKPTVEYAAKTYVIDYAKKTTLKYDDVLEEVSRIDDPSDEILKGEKVAPNAADSDHFAFAEYETDYGFVDYTDIHSGSDQDTNKFRIEYTPKTMNWDGYDKLFIMGKPTSDYTPDDPDSIFQGNVWGLLTVLPANNVYYEDSFITQESSGEEGTGTVGITYTGAWTEDGNGTAVKNEEHANGDVMGWETSLADDIQYSDGTAHKASGSGTATFSFTGTGVDIYSRTNIDTGTIIVRLTGTAESGKKEAKTYILSNKAKSGDYYQIPTCTFENLDYGTYNVKITVTSAAKAQGRLDYYLDGIRVYNPIQPKESEELVQEAYAEELNAVFTEVKSLLDDDKVAFIDEDSEGNPVEKSYADATEGIYAPEHEVYVKAGSFVVIAAKDTTKNYYIGIKAPEGETSIEITNGSDKTAKVIGHSTDLYYKVIPASSGEIVIRNTGEKLLSLTKIRTTNSDNTGTEPDAVGFDAVGPERALAAVANFRLLSFADDLEEVLTPEEAEIVEPAEPEEVIEEVVEKTPEEPEVEIVELTEEDVTIENPVPEETPKPAPSSNSSLLKRFVQSLFSSILRLFR